MLKSTLEKISTNVSLRENKVMKFILELESENYGSEENRTYLEKKYFELLERFKYED